ncbi:MAG: DAK2 domain-containing protein [Acholeplasmatales bacterium]|jgi:DAK2 domain fusion protein YloV|nr:DAK2 domain-containing protein [Acholeplasmatales bacterium]
MANQTVSGLLFKQMVSNGAVNLKNNRKEIDHLNVFPVPDGDTGTNMQMTMMAGIKQVNNLDSTSIVDISKILSRGLISGARGNSGVILSQFFRGFSDSVSKLDRESLTIDEFVQALLKGAEMAYKVVSVPVEGTILTVVREAAEKVMAEKESFNSLEDCLKTYLEEAKHSLSLTPEKLPVLKEAGVVDSGGAGFIKIIEGMSLALQGIILQESLQTESDDIYFGVRNLGDVDIKNAFCTEFIVKLARPEIFNDANLKDSLMAIGDSLVLVTDEEILKVHVHTNVPGTVLTLAQKFGEIQTVKIENMRIQHSSIVSSNKEILEERSKGPKVHTKYTLIAACQGSGIKETFKTLGVNYIIDGGQTMNPSTEDFLSAINEFDSDHYIILPNNGNVIMAAEQTKLLLPEKDIRVLKTKTVAQGYSSLIFFDPEGDCDINMAEMGETLEKVKSGEITYSVRNTTLDGMKIKKNDFIGILDGIIKSVNSTRLKCVKDLLGKMIDENTQILTIFYGDSVNLDEIDDVVTFAKKSSPDLEVEVVNGNQAIYSYIFSVE